MEIYNIRTYVPQLKTDRLAGFSEQKITDSWSSCFAFEDFEQEKNYSTIYRKILKRNPDGSPVELIVNIPLFVHPRVLAEFTGHHQQYVQNIDTCSIVNAKHFKHFVTSNC